LLGAGAALGSSVALEYIQIIGAALVFLYAWKRLGTRRVWLVAAGGLPFGLLIMLYHYSAFGHPFDFPYKYAIPLLATDQQQQLLEIDHPTWDRLLAVAFGPQRGLFIYNPVLLLTVFLFLKDLATDRQRVAEGLLALGLLAAYLVFQASSPLATFTWGIGPRYAAAMLPLVLLGVALVKTPLERKAFYWLAGVSAAVNWLMVQRDIEPQHHEFPLGDALVALLENGPSNSALEIVLPLSGVSSPMLTWTVGVLAHGALAVVLFWLWRKTKPLASA
jgi:hypothetical protein